MPRPRELNDLATQRHKAVAAEHSKSSTEGLIVTKLPSFHWSLCLTNLKTKQELHGSYRIAGKFGGEHLANLTNRL